MTILKLSVGKLTRALKSVNALVDTAPITFHKDRLQIETVDSGNVAAVTMHLQKDAFNEYEADGLEKHLDIEQLSQILQKFEVDQIATLTHKDENNRFELSVDSFSFDLSPIHPESARSGQKAGGINPPAEIVLQASEIQKAVRLADMFSDELVMGIDDDNSLFYINATGDADRMAVSFSEEDNSVTHIESKRAHSIYSRSYLSQMMKNVSPSQDLTLQLGEEYPAKLTFDIADMEGQVTYGLAPRFK